MVDFLKHIDYSKEVKENPVLKDHIIKVAKELAAQHKDDDNYKQPVNDNDLSNIVVLAGLPKIPQDKVEKLQGFFKGKILPGLELPEPTIEFDIRNNEMVGTALLTFADQDTAKNASLKLNGFAFDKNHTLSACTNEDFDEMINLNETYAPPKYLSRADLQEWLKDSRSREQLLVRAQNRYYLQWFDHVTKTETIAFKSNFEEFGEVNRFDWSKSGSYLITFHDAGFGLWGGNSFEKLNFYPHPEVQQVEFSPDETYALSFNGTVNDAPNSENYIVWRVVTAGKLRTFKATPSEAWGSYKWSFDSKYLASCGNDLLNIYELPTMSRIIDPQTQKRAPLKVQNIQNLEWKPNKNILCVAAYKPQASKGEGTGKIYIIEVPSRNILKWKTITWEFSDCSIHWETAGNKVVLVLKKLLKNKKFSTVIQVGDIKHNIVTVEEHEFPDAKVVNVDDSGRKIAVLSVDPTNRDAPAGLYGYNIEIFKTDEEVRGKYLQKIGDLTDKYASHVLWSPNGNFFAIVNTDKLSAKIGTLEFGFIKANTLEIIKATKFNYMNYAAWDASGRHLVSASNKGAYTIWTAFGEAVIKDTFNEITQVQWRNKPKLLLPAEVESTLTAKLKDYSKKFEEDDDRILNEDKYKKEEIRKKNLADFTGFIQQKRKVWTEAKEERVKLLGFDEDHLQNTVQEEIIEAEEPITTKK